MQKTLTSNLKMTTIWPELVNHRIQGIDSQLEEVRIETRGALLLVWGIIHRKVICLNGRNECRKVEDRVQFAANLSLTEEPGRVQLENLPLSNIELTQNYFVFQPRPGGNSPALLEQAFTLLIRYPPAPPGPARAVTPVWARVVAKNGQGSVVLDLPAGLLGPTVTPRQFTGSIRIHSPVCPPVISGVVKGIITYCSPQKALKEMEFETTIDFLLEQPPEVQTNQQLWVTGDLIGARWRVAPGGGWLLETKLLYHWRVIEERDLWINLVEGGRSPVPACLNNYAAITRLKKFDLQLPRNYALSGWNFEPDEIKIRISECREKLVPPGLLLSGKLVFEAYGIDEAGLERYQTQIALFEELAPLNGVHLQKEPPGQILVQNLPEVKLIRSDLKNGIQRVEVLLKFLISLYREQIVAIPTSGSSGNRIIADLIGESREFTLERETILKLQVRPRQILKLKLRALQADSVVNDGWIGIDGRMEVAVCFLDPKSHYCETNFAPLFQGAFIWDKLQLKDSVRVQCRLNHYSYTWEGMRVLCRYWLTLTLENRRETEIWVETPAPQYKRDDLYPEDFIHRYSGENQAGFNRAATAIATGRLGAAPSTSLCMPTGATQRLIMTGEIPLKTGTARETGTSSLRLSGASCRMAAGGVLIEGALRGIIEYWDQANFLRQETVEVSFWRLSQNYLGILWNHRNLQMELGEVTVSPVIPSLRGKGKVRVSFELIVSKT